MPEITGTPEPAAERHAYRHTMAADGRESLAHMLVFPEHGVAGFIYPTVRADGAAKGRASLFGPGVADPIHEQVEEKVTSAMDFDDWRVGPLTMRVVEPHQKVEIGWDGNRLKFDGRYEAVHPAYTFGSHPGGNPPYYGDDRTEQHGRITGTLEYDGKKLDVVGHMIRDHSWGPRVWGLNQHHKWFHAATEQTSIHVFEMMSFGRREVRGYLYRDGVMRHVTAFDYEIRYDADMMQAQFRSSVVDADGRRALVDATTLASAQMEFDPMVYLNEAALVLDVDGEHGTGWAEFCWNRNYLDFARGYVERFGN